jgi:DNA modification methylase
VSFYTDPLVELHLGDCLDVLPTLPAETVDAVVTDPPYNLTFMSKEWDRHVTPAAFQAWCEQWGREALRVTKPGGYLLAFGGTRTHHRLVCALEDAGWIIRDELDWIYASGFPKGKANLKPAHEPIVLARKPGPLRPLGIDAGRISTEGESFSVPQSDPAKRGGTVGTDLGISRSDVEDFQAAQRASIERTQTLGRWPSNVLLSDPELFDQANPGVVGSGGTEEGVGYSRFFSIPGEAFERFWSKADKSGGCWTWTASRDIQGYGRFALNAKKRNVYAHRLAWELANGPIPDGMHVLHYCDNPPCVRPAHLFIGSHADNMRDMAAKGRGSSNGQVGEARYNAKLTDDIVREARELREQGWRYVDLAARYGVGASSISAAVRGVKWSHVEPMALIIPKADRAERERGVERADGTRGNNHPTVKSLDLMRHLVRLVTPVDGVVLDPFLGSGTTCLAASEEGFRSIGIERELEYLEIAKGRLMATPMGLGLFGNEEPAA